MKKRALYLYHRPDATDTLHWRRSCPRCQGGPAKSRVIVIGQDWQEAENLLDAPPSRVIERALSTFHGRVCRECVPENVLARL
jgi:hypothetical protein